MAVRGHFIGDYSLHEPGTGEGIGASDFLLVTDKTTPFSYVDANGKVIFTIDRSFITDGATTPWFLQWVPWLRRYGRIRKAAFGHDWLWVLEHLGEQPLSFFKTNAIFREMCIVCELRVWQAWTCWLAVTLFGWHMWLGKNYRRRQALACVNLAGTIMRRKGIVR